MAPSPSLGHRLRSQRPPEAAKTAVPSAGRGSSATAAETTNTTTTVTATTAIQHRQETCSPSSSRNKVPSPSKRAPRQFAFLSLLSVVLLSQSAGAGIALEVIVVVFNLLPPPPPAGDPAAHALDMASRLALFGASCLSMVYVLLHLLAARRTQRLCCARIQQQQQQGGKDEVVFSASQLGAAASEEKCQAAATTSAAAAGRGQSGTEPAGESRDDSHNGDDKSDADDLELLQRPGREFVVRLAVLLARVSVPVWIATVVLAALAAVRTELHVKMGVHRKVPWLGLLASGASLLSSLLVLFVIQASDRPFVTAAISRPSARSAPDEAITQTQRHDPGSSWSGAPTVFRASVDSDVGIPQPSKHSPAASSSSSRLTRTRSQFVPPPLASVFLAGPEPASSRDQGSGSGSGSGPRDRWTTYSAGPDNGGTIDGEFAWRPPMRQSMILSNNNGIDDNTKRPSSVRDLATFRGSGVTSFGQINALMDHVNRVEQQQQQQQQQKEQQQEQQQRKWERAISARGVPGVRRGLPGVEPTVPRIPMQAENEAEDGVENTSAASGLRRSSSALVRDSDISTPQWTNNSTGTPAVEELQDRMAEVSVPNAEPRETETPQDDGASWAERSRLRGASLDKDLSGGGGGESGTKAETRGKGYGLETERPLPNNQTNFSRPRTAAAALMQARIGRRLLQAVQEQEEGTGSSDAENGESATAETTTASGIVPVTGEAPRPRTAAAALMQEKIGKRIRAVKEQMRP